VQTRFFFQREAGVAKETGDATYINLIPGKKKRRTSLNMTYCNLIMSLTVHSCCCNTHVNRNVCDIRKLTDQQVQANCELESHSVRFVHSFILS